MRVPSVAVLGAGIVGAAVAHAAAAAGAQVTIVDAAAPAAGTSGTSLAWLNSNRKQPRSYHDFSVRAMRAWHRLAAELGRPDWYVPTGHLAWAVAEDQRAELSGTVARLRDWGYRVTEPDARTVADLEPRLRMPPDAYVAYFPDEAFIHPAEAVRALLTRAGGLGARLLDQVGPAAFDLAGSRVAGIRLADGQLIRADAYVCCAGAHTPSLIRPLGAEIPLVHPEEPGSLAPGLVATVRTDTRLLARVVHPPDLSLRPTSPTGLRMDAEDISLRVTTATGQADLDRHALELHDRARRALTGIPAGAAVEARLCIRPLPTDGLPITGWLPAHDNVYLVVGHSGATLAALLAELATAEIVTGHTDPDLAGYRLDRFSTT